MIGPPPPPPLNERGETNRWLVGIMGAVGGLMVLVVIGFQAQIDSRQDDALRSVVETMREINLRQDESSRELSSNLNKANERQDEALKDVTDKLVEATKNIAVISAEGKHR